MIDNRLGYLCSCGQYHEPEYGQLHIGLKYSSTSADPVPTSGCFRRGIGRNEIAAMRICYELVNAQREYFAESPDGEVKQYAQKFVSDKGTHNGLYWDTERGEPDSPIGPHLAYAGGDPRAQTQELIRFMATISRS